MIINSKEAMDCKGESFLAFPSTLDSSLNQICLQFTTL